MPPLQAFVVVTGGSEGIGFAIAHRFARRGQHVLLVARRQGRLDVAAGEIRARPGVALPSGVHVLTLALDICDPGAAGLIESFLSEHGGYVETLVNCAGIGLSGAFDGHQPEAIERLLTLNVLALTQVTRHFIPAMRARRGGGILTVASLGGVIPGPYQAVYYASKAYALSLSEAIAAEVARDGVRVTVVAPGPVATGFHARMRAQHSLYRRLLPTLTAETVAHWSVLAYSLGLRSVTPGFVNTVLYVCLRILPHRIVIPMVAFLLRPRGLEARDARRTE